MVVLGGGVVSYERGIPVSDLPMQVAAENAERKRRADNLLVRIHFIIEMIW